MVDFQKHLVTTEFECFLSNFHMIERNTPFQNWKNVNFFYNDNLLSLYDIEENCKNSRPLLVLKHSMHFAC